MGPKGEFPFRAGESVLELPVPRTVRIDGQERSFFIGELEGLIDWKRLVDGRIGQRHGSLFVAECRGLKKWPYPEVSLKLVRQKRQGWNGWTVTNILHSNRLNPPTNMARTDRPSASSPASRMRAHGVSYATPAEAMSDLFQYTAAFLQPKPPPLLSRIGEKWRRRQVGRRKTWSEKNPTQRNPLGRVLADQFIKADKLRRL